MLFFIFLSMEKYKKIEICLKEDYNKGENKKIYYIFLKK